jgi:hypothetical protein
MVLEVNRDAGGDCGGSDETNKNMMQRLIIADMQGNS